MIVRILILVGIFLTFAMANSFAPRDSKQRRTEAWLEDQVPMQVAGQPFVSGGENPKQSYKMDENTYKILEPYGIVCRQFATPTGMIDVVIIASDNSHSFHDPRICFRSQNLEILDERLAEVDTKTHGKVKVTLLRIKQNGKFAHAAYVWKGPAGFERTSNRVMLAMFLAELKTGKHQEGAFYRFMDSSGNEDPAGLLQFVGEFMDEAGKTSNGFL